MRPTRSSSRTDDWMVETMSRKASSPHSRPKRMIDGPKVFRVDDQEGARAWAWPPIAWLPVRSTIDVKTGPFRQPVSAS